MFDEYLLRLGRETVGDVDRVRRSVKGARADPLIDRLSDVWPFFCDAGELLLLGSVIAVRSEDLKEEMDRW